MSLPRSHTENELILVLYLTGIWIILHKQLLLLPQRLPALEPVQRPPEWMGEDKETDRRSLRKGIAWWKVKKESKKILSICNQSLCQIINSGAEEVQLCFVWSADVIEQHSLAVKALFHNAQLSSVYPLNPTLRRVLSLIVATALQTARVYWNLGGQTHRTNFVYRFPGLHFSPWTFNYNCCREGTCTLCRGLAHLKQLSGFDIWAILRWQI